MNIDRSWHLPFSPAQVYAAWVSNDTVIHPATRMDIKPEVGGHYRLYAAGEGFTMSNEGTFLEVVPDSRLRYTWQWQGESELTEVSVDFLPHEGGTRLRVQHGEFLTEESRLNHDNGWNSYVAGITQLLSQ